MLQNSVKLILVEGIPGSGKSTIAKKIAGFYRENGVLVNLYNEGDYHPADLAWQARLPIAAFEKILSTYGQVADGILQKTHMEEGYAVVSYTQVETEWYEFYSDMEQYQVYGGRAPLQLFCELHRTRWSAFGAQAAQSNELNVFECVFFQNYLSELRDFHLADSSTILAHCQTLLQAVEKLSPILFYLKQSSVQTTIQRVGEERIDPHGRWIDKMVQHMENTPYAQSLGRKGIAGAIQGLEERQAAELAMIPVLPVTAHVIENPSFDWGAVWQQIVTKLPLL